MNKLYSSVEKTPPPLPPSSEPVMENLAEWMEVETDTIKTLSEATGMAVERYEMVQGAMEHLGAQRLCSDAYMTSLECLTPMTRSIGERLGVLTMPAMEDFRNRYAAESAHGYAMEGFREMISRVWEKIKDFFRSFFKKITLFLKRIARANLDLESYERYCDQLVAKLSANKASCKDNTPLRSELPSMLASKSERSVDSDFILNQGQAKVRYLLDKVQDISPNGDGGRFITAGLKTFQTQLKHLVSDRTVQSSADGMEETIAALKESSFGLVGRLFSHHIDSPRELPEEVRVAMQNTYSGKDFKVDDLVLMSMSEQSDPYKALPRGVNMYMAHVSGSDIFISGYKEKDSVVENMLKPIANLNNLVNFHKEYKKTLGSLNMKGIDSYVESVGKDIDSILSILQKEYGALMDTFKGVKKAYTAEYLCAAMIHLKKTNVYVAGTLENIFQGVMEKQTGQSSAETIDARASLGRELSVLENAGVDADYSDVTESLKRVMKVIPENVNMVIDILFDTFKSSLQTGQENPMHGQLVALNKHLVNVFDRLKNLYQGLMTDFYAVLTELRYATIKYIYDSATRYSY